MKNNVPEMALPIAEDNVYLNIIIDRYKNINLKELLKTMAKIQKNIRISEELNEKVKIKAVKDKVTASELITRYIEEGLKRDSNQATLDYDVK